MCAAMSAVVTLACALCVAWLSPDYSVWLAWQLLLILWVLLECLESSLDILELTS